MAEVMLDSTPALQVESPGLGRASFTMGRPVFYCSTEGQDGSKRWFFGSKERIKAILRPVGVKAVFHYGLSRKKALQRCLRREGFFLCEI